MRFYSYINEKKNLNEMIELLIKDCKPFLKDFKTRYKENFLWSGRKKITYFEKKQVRKNRTPKDTPTAIHHEMDNWFKKKFGVNARSNALFCSFDSHVLSTYGRAHLIFPIGNYKLLSSNKIFDIFSNLEELFADIIGTFMFRWDEVEEKGKEDEFIDKLISQLENANYKYNQYNDSEQMLVSKDYYIMLPPNELDFIDLKHELLHRKL